MTQRMTIAIGACVLLVGVLTGCQQPKMSVDEMMAQPSRPAELDQLSAFIGTWEGQWEMTIQGAEKPETGKSHDTYSWEADKWALRAQSEGTLGSHKMLGAGLWVWDAQSKLFRYGSIDNYGMIMAGTAKYDAKAQTWTMKGRTRDTVHGRDSIGEGTLRLTGGNAMEWSWTEWDSWHLVKFMEMKGKAHKK